MRAILIIGGAVMAMTGAAAAADQHVDGHYFYTDIPASHGASAARDFASFNIAGEPIFLRAQGRKARAEADGMTAEIEEMRKHAHVFDRAAQPAIFTIEARIRF